MLTFSPVHGVWSMKRPHLRWTVLGLAEVSLNQDGRTNSQKVVNAAGLLISVLNTWYRRYFFTFCHYRTEYRNSFIFLVSREYRRSFFTI